MLIDAYDAVMASPRLAAVKVHAFGDESLLNAPGANPRIIWIPTTDAFGPPDTLGTYGISAETEKQAFVDGRRVVVTSRFLRSAGARLHLFTDYGPNGQRQMEELIRQVAMAFYEELKAPGMNFGLGALEWVPRSAISNNSIECIWAVAVPVPIWDTTPAQLLKEIDTSGSRVTGATE